jgi:8-oxo-dGTP pyrophosphatase MutT (NUDIX family)
MRKATLCFLVQGSPPKDVLLGLKKAGFGAGKFNGFGGKVERSETVAMAAVRELQEEAGVQVSPEDLKEVAHLTFYFPASPSWDQAVHVFLATEWQGSPSESQEMMPAWFAVDDLPFDQMWQDDPHWLPRILAGERVRACFTFQEDNETLDQLEMAPWTGCTRRHPLPAEKE